MNMSGNTVRDRFWMWSHQEGSHNGRWNLPGNSRMTPVEAALYMGTPNLINVVFNNQPEPPFTRQAIAMRPLNQVVWSIVGDSASLRNNDRTDLEEVISLAKSFPNVTGAIMDDFFHSDPVKAGAEARYSVEQIAGFRRSLNRQTPPMDLWVVMYSNQLDRPAAPYLQSCDVVTFWTWRAEHLAFLESGFDKFERLCPKQRKVLGCYMWDYGDSKPMSIRNMELQCSLGLEWLLSGRIDGMIFLASCICDLEIEAVEWTREWIQEVADQPVASRRGSATDNRPSLRSSKPR